MAPRPPPLTLHLLLCNTSSTRPGLWDPLAQVVTSHMQAPQEPELLPAKAWFLSNPHRPPSQRQQSFCLPRLLVPWQAHPSSSQRSQLHLLVANSGVSPQPSPTLPASLLSPPGDFRGFLHFTDEDSIWAQRGQSPRVKQPGSSRLGRESRALLSAVF